MLFSTEIADAYPKEAEVKSWVRTYGLLKGILEIEDTFLLNKALKPNRINFMVWGCVNLSKPGIVNLKVQNEEVELSYDQNDFIAKLDSIQLNEEKFTRIWDKEIYRLSLIAKKLKISGKYRYSIHKVQIDSK